MAYKLNPFTGKLDDSVTLTGSGTVAAAQDGTAAVPGINFANDLNTGIYRPGADQIAISTNGTGKLFIDSSGNVGIGTSSSAAKVDIRSANDPTTQANVLTVRNSGSASYAAAMAASSDGGAFIARGNATNQGEIQFATTDGSYANYTERMRIDSSGKVGIGTSSPSAEIHVAADDPQFLLQRTGSYSASAGPSIQFQGRGPNATNYNFGKIQAVSSGSNNAGVLQFFTNNAGSQSEHMRIDSNGKVGIGGNPTSQLHLFAPSGTYNPAEIGFTSRNATNTLLPFAKIESRHAGFGAESSNLNIITTDGSANQNIVASFYYDGSAALPFVYGDTVGATNRDLYIDSTGKLGYVSSIRASKANIAVLSDVDWLYQLEPVSFNRRKRDEDENYTEETYSELEYGLIAEDAEIVNPELCFYDDVEGVQELRGIHYSKLIAPLLKAVQDIKKENESLKSRVAALEAN